MDTSKIKVTPADVLCGKESSSYNHAGNKRFRELVMASLATYRKADSRLQKALVVKNTIASIRSQGGRFLKKDPTTGQWSEQSAEEAKDKVARAIRDAAQFRDTKKKRRASRRQEQRSAHTLQQQQYKQPPHNQQWLEGITSGRDVEQHTSNVAPTTASFGPHCFLSGTAPAHSPKVLKRTEDPLYGSVPHSTSISRMPQYDTESLKSHVKGNSPVDATTTTESTSCGVHRPQSLLQTSQTSQTSQIHASELFGGGHSSTVQQAAAIRSGHSVAKQSLRTQKERADKDGRDLDSFLLRMNSTLLSTCQPGENLCKSTNQQVVAMGRPVRDCYSHLSNPEDRGYRPTTSVPSGSGVAEIRPSSVQPVVPGTEDSGGDTSLDSLKNKPKGPTSTNDGSMGRGHCPRELVEGQGKLKGDARWLPRMSSWPQDNSRVAASHSTRERDAGPASTAHVHLDNIQANRLCQDLASLEDELQVLNLHHRGLARPTSTNTASATSSSKAKSPQPQFPYFRPIPQTNDSASKPLSAASVPPVEADSKRVSIPESLSGLSTVQNDTSRSRQSQHRAADDNNKEQSKDSDDEFLEQIESVLGSMPSAKDQQDLMNTSLGDSSLW